MTTCASTLTTAHNPKALDSEKLHVAVGVICNDRGEYLIAQRRATSHQAGLWEFPGGKVEHGETVQQALMRELREELGIDVTRLRPLIKISHRYLNGPAVLLDVWRVENFAGEPHGAEGQPVRWVGSESLLDFPFPEANGPIVSAARLPHRYAILDCKPDADEQSVLYQLEHLFRRGHRLIQFRSKAMGDDRYRLLAKAAQAYCRLQKIALLLNADPDLAVELGAAGVHLNGQRLLTLTRRPLAKRLWVAASCHNREELLHAKSIGVDFAVLGPVKVTASHPEVLPQGWDGFACLVELAGFPVFALGGMTEDDLPHAQALGGQGIAAIRSFREA